MEYEDFSLRIEPRRGDVYPVSVLRSPAGEARSSFSLPFDPAQIGDLLLALGRTVRGSTEAVKRQVSLAATRTAPQQIGDQLFRALFSGPVRDLFFERQCLPHGVVSLARQRRLRLSRTGRSRWGLARPESRRAMWSKLQKERGLNGHLYQPNRRP